MVNLKINNIPVSVPEGTTLLEAAKSVGIKIPTLCYMKSINEIGACRVCVCEVKGARSFVAACVYPVNEGMEAFTDTPAIRQARKTTIELLLSNHNKSCLSCERNLNCELQKLSYEYGCDMNAYAGEKTPSEVDFSTEYLVRDNSKCVLCRRCVATCKAIQHVGVIGTRNRGFATDVGCAFGEELNASSCAACGQCINVCPTGALHEKSEIDNVRAAIDDPEKIVVVGAAPAVRAALGEEFGYPIGTNVEGKMLTALRMLGFDKVFDVNFGADLTIMEEAHEFIERAVKGENLPLITSCSPGWIRFMEYYYPELIKNVSSCKSPQQMFGACVKTYYAEKLGVDPEKLYVVTVMPCVAKKFEKTRAGESAAGVPDIDAVITTRELAKMIKSKGVIFNELPDGKYDDPLGEYTGAGVIFGATGGVMEAALRTAVETLTGEELKAVDFTEVRGTNGIKEATYEVGGKKINVAVASGLENAKTLCDQIKNGTCKYQFIEIMACPGGCVNGGGQPIQSAFVRRNNDIRALRASVLYNIDKDSKIRKSHENEFIKKIYADYFEAPGSHKAHEVLHTSYVKRNKY
ncbi:MAG: NADH-dependent [FeFe] hydrogenase, group A6 [Candidatus Borkfalkiaceae bacterium]|nr:NADH-dependent [FeFe] hydrogenase, group A6 [Christensenellaceae bacterium]